MPTAPKPVRTENVGGRPSKFHTKLLPQVRRLAKIGATELEVADLLGISWLTFQKWQSQYPQFVRALELGKKQSNKRVSRALYHRAIGYTHEQERAFNDKGNIIKAVVREHVPPDVNAVKFWLTNRDAENWQDRSGLDLTGSVNIVASTLSAARQRALAAKSSSKIIEADIAPELEAGDADSE